jgi:hypothetical protein
MAEAAVTPEAAVISEEAAVVIRRAADILAGDVPALVVSGLLDRPAICTIIAMPTRATLTPGMETVAPGTGTVAPGTETATGADTARRRSMSTIIVFPSDSFRTGTQGGDTTITGTTGILITRITGMTIPITIRTTAIQATATTLAETDQRASKC